MSMKLPHPSDPGFCLMSTIVSRAHQLHWVAVGSLLIEMEDLDEQEDEEITNMECPLVQLGLP